MSMSDMLDMWKEWGGSVQKRTDGRKRSDSKWAPENLSTRNSGSRRSIPQSRHNDTDSDTPVQQPDKGKKRQSAAEIDELPFKKQASNVQGRTEDPGLSADMITTEEMSAGEIFFNSCMAEKMSATD